MPMDAVRGRDAVGALAAPVHDVGLEFRPEEAGSQPMKCLECSRVAGHWRCVVCGEDVSAQLSRDDDQHQSLVVIA